MMRSVSLQIFDDVIKSTVSVVSPAQFNPILGTVDYWAVQACTTFVSGSPTMTVTSEHSADNQNWFVIGTDITTGTVAIANDASYWGTRVGLLGLFPVMANLRFRIGLSAASPVARVRLYFTGRVQGASAPAGGASALQGGGMQSLAGRPQ